MLLAVVGAVVQVAGHRWIEIVMPPVVTGTIVALIGFNLAPAAWNNVHKAPVTAIITLGSIILVTVLFKGLVGRLAILIGVLVGYLAAWIRGEVSFAGLAAWPGSGCRRSTRRRSRGRWSACSPRWCSCSSRRTSAT